MYKVSDVCSGSAEPSRGVVGGEATGIRMGTAGIGAVVSILSLFVCVCLASRNASTLPMQTLPHSILLHLS